MASENRQERRLLRPMSRADLGNASDTEAESAAGGGEGVFRRRQASVYDAVAGLCIILINLHVHQETCSSLI